MVFALALAAGVHMLAHGVRALRFWLLCGARRLSFAGTLRLFYLYNVLAFALPLYVTEPARLFHLARAARSWGDVAVAYVVHRGLDVLGIATMLALLACLTDIAQAPVETPLPWALLVGLSIIALLVLGFVASWPAASPSVEAYLLNHHQSRLGVRLMRAWTAVSQATVRMRRHNGGFFVAALLLTLLAWLGDFVALALIAPPQAIAELARIWIDGSLHKLLAFLPSSAVISHNAAALFVAQAALLTLIEAGAALRRAWPIGRVVRFWPDVRRLWRPASSAGVAHHCSPIHLPGRPAVEPRA